MVAEPKLLWSILPSKHLITALNRGLLLTGESAAAQQAASKMENGNQSFFMIFFAETS